MYIYVCVIQSPNVNDKRYQHRYPWPSLATPPYRLLLPQVLKATSRIGTELLYVGSSWSSCLCTSMWRGPQEYITYELVPTSPAVSRMSGSSNFDSFRDGWLVAVQLLVCGVLTPGLVQYCSQHSCVIAVKLYWIRNKQNGGWEWNGNLYNINKYNTCQQCEERYQLLVVTTSSAKSSPPHNSVQCIYEEWDIPITIHC